MNAWYSAHTVLIQLTLSNLLLALSMYFPLRAGVFSFAGVGSFGIGAYVVAIGVGRYSLGGPVALLAGIAIAAAIGYLLAWLVQRLNGLYLGMTTIAFDLILSVVVVNGGHLTGGAQGLFGVLSNVSIPAVAAGAAVVCVVLALSERGAAGRKTRVVRSSPELASSLGINVPRTRRWSFVVSGALGACGGGVSVLFTTTVAPTSIGFPLVVLALTMIIVGGSTSWLGALIGAVIFTWLPSAISFLSQWQTIVYGVLVTLAAVCVPGGIVGLIEMTHKTLRQRRARAGIDETLMAPGGAGVTAQLGAQNPTPTEQTLGNSK